MGNKGRTFPPEVLTRDEVRALMAACGTSWTGERNRALIFTLWRSGLRVSEALDLEPKDVDTTACSIRVLHGKGDRARTVGIDQRTGRELDRWFRLREEATLNVSSPVFCTKQGGRLQSAYVRRMLPRVAKKAGIRKRVHAHGLRHTLAFELMMEGVPTSIIQKQLGHASLATTTRYLDHIAPRDVIEKLRSREW